MRPVPDKHGSIEILLSLKFLGHFKAKNCLCMDKYNFICMDHHTNNTINIQIYVDTLFYTKTAVYLLIR